MTNCLAYQYSKNDQCNQHIQRCTLLKEFGLNFTYTPETDIHRPKVAKHHNETAKKAEKKKKEKKANEASSADASNPSTSTSNTNTNLIPTTLVHSGRDAVNPFTTVGKNGGNAKLEGEAKQAEANNLVCQVKASQDKANALVEAENNKKSVGSISKAKA